jgi:deoxyribodipyrimidine photolyase-related protein
MRSVALIFPNQLYKVSPILAEEVEKTLLVEDSLFFGDNQYPAQFHKQKLAFQRATMAHYAKRLSKQGHKTQIVPYQADSSLPSICQQLKAQGIDQLIIVATTDFLLIKRLRLATEKSGLALRELPDPGFINSCEENTQWRAQRKRWFMADFYQWQRKRLDILMDGDKPRGGKWSFDESNRKKIPNKEIASIPQIPKVKQDDQIKAAIESVTAQFRSNPGSLEQWHYPVTHQQAEKWLEQFFEQRFAKFGDYEDAMVAGHCWLYHSVLTPMLNIGLLTPSLVVERTLKYAKLNDTPLNSVEGFIRQIIGWREFMRATYDDLGVPMRTTNHWRHHRPLPSGFYDATTGIDPIDDALLRILDTGYCHHIERLMLIGGFLFLCETDPDEIYRWFMEMFVDSFDWVMVPNVYAMSQHADGGAITTKPYFSGSNYVLKMSNYKKGEWSVVWDGLFWRWIHKNQKALAGNPRWAMMVSNVKKMDKEKLKKHLAVANAYLDGQS